MKRGSMTTSHAQGSSAKTNPVSFAARIPSSSPLTREERDVLLNPPTGQFAGQEWWALFARAQERLKAARSATQKAAHG